MTRPLRSQNPLAPLFKPPAVGAGFPMELRTGLVKFWNPLTGTHDIELDGVLFSNLPMNTSMNIATVKAGDTVTLIAARDSRGVVTYSVLAAFARPPL